MRLDTTIESATNLTLIRKLTGCSEAIGMAVFAAADNDIVNMVNLTDDQLKKAGLTYEQLMKLRAGVELTRRYLSQYGQQQTRRVTDAADAIKFVSEAMGPVVCDSSQERFWMISLDIRNKVVHIHEISRGTVNSTTIDLSEIARHALNDHASRVVLVHNHPSGETDPSKEDIDSTNKVVNGLRNFDIRVLDHIIMGRKEQDYFSFARAGMV